MSTTASQQGETIPGVCHAIVVESDVTPKKIKPYKAIKPKDIQSVSKENPDNFTEKGTDDIKKENEGNVVITKLKKEV